MRYFEEPSVDNPSYPCGICNKNIGKNHRYVRCSICNYRVHIKCNDISKKVYEKLRDQDECIICLKCNEEILPLFPPSQNLQNNNIDTHSQHLYENIKSFFKGMNEFIDSSVENTENNVLPLNCKYFDTNDFNYKTSPDLFSIFHLNIASLSKHKDELDTFFNMLDYSFNIIGITETKIRKDILPTSDISIKGYDIYHTPTESEKGGALLYIADNLKCKPRKDLDSILYKSCELESVFVEIVNSKRKNTIVGCIYRHPIMDLQNFNQNYLHPIMEKLSTENKKLYLLGDFNVDLIENDVHIETLTFFDTLTSNFFVPHIILPTRISKMKKSLIDNIFSNSDNFNEGISGNFTIPISDHLAQFLIIPDGHETVNKKQDIYKRDTKNLNRENFISDMIQIDWSTTINLESNNPNDSLNNLETKINDLIETHMPLKKMSKK